jgi:hypothetical protein
MPGEEYSLGKSFLQDGPSTAQSIRLARKAKVSPEHCITSSFHFAPPLYSKILKEVPE